jgi:cytochrome c-type biogenesis protein CcmH
MTALTAFILCALALLVGCVLWLIRPLVWARPLASPSRQSLNTAIYQEELAKLKLDLSAGLVAASAFEEAQTELMARYLQDTQAQDQAVDASFKPARVTQWALVVLLPLSAVCIYLVLGQPMALVWNPESQSSASKNLEVTQADIERMVSALADKVAQDPSNLEGLAILVRSYKALGRMQEAERAYDRSALDLQNNAAMLSDYADVAAANAQGVFTGKPQQLIDQALRLDPNDLMGLWLAGTAAFDAKQYPKALAHWERLFKLLPPQSEDAKVIGKAIDRVKLQMGPSTKP